MDGLRKTSVFAAALIVPLFFGSCAFGIVTNTPVTTVAGYEVALESVLRSIPTEYIDLARTSLHVAYQHTSHGTHVAYGAFGLQDYKDGDDALFGITNNNPTEGFLDFRDYAIGSPIDLSNGVDTLEEGQPLFVHGTRTYLDDPENAEINVIMWSWCSIGDHNIDNYLNGMSTLISEYGPGGTKIGSGAGQRANPVTFIFMTGHAEVSNVGDGRPKN